MSLWSRVLNVFRTDRLNTDFEDELEAHVADAVAEGRDPVEARRALGPAAAHRDSSRDVRVLPWLDSLRADAIFAARQIRKNPITSTAAVLSLALAIGACTSAFRLIDAVLLRPLPVSEPERLYVFARQGVGADGRSISYDSCAYPMFALMRDAVRNEAELLAISYAERIELTFGTQTDFEKVYRQYVSGRMFAAFGIQPAIGRLLTENDDRKPQSHPYAVISHDYWTRRFGNATDVIGRTLRIGDRAYEIVGVSAAGFTGTEPGTVVDLFIPTMMSPSVERNDSTWHRTFVLIKPGTAVEQLTKKLHATTYAFESERAKGFKGFSSEHLARFLNQTVVLEPASAGASALQQRNRESFLALAVLVGLVLLIACVNLANLMTGRASARARELALRVSIGAGRARLVQLVLVESALLAVASTAVGSLLAWWSVPFIAGMLNPPDNPARLSLPWDLRVFGFAAVLSIVVAFLFGLAPALRASGVKPASILKGGDDPHARRRLMHGLVALQVAFCFVVLIVGTLFMATYEHLVHQSPGFSPERVLTVTTISTTPQSTVMWDQIADHVLTLPGVEKVAIMDRPLLDGYAWNGFIMVNGRPPIDELTFFRTVSSGWLETMKIPLLAGRDFNANDVYPRAALVNEVFARTYFGRDNPVGKTFSRSASKEQFQIVGLVGDARYRTVRDPVPPVAYFPMQGINDDGTSSTRRDATLIVRTVATNPLTMAPILRQEIPRARPGFRVSNIRSQQEINDAQTVRERLLATLASFFAAVALLLAGVGLYGVLDYSVLQRRREIGIRMALGARASDVARRVTADSFWMVLPGAAAGLAAGLASEHYIDALLYRVKATDPLLLAVPAMTLLLVAMLAVAPAAFRAVRTDPARTLRGD